MTDKPKRPKVTVTKPATERGKAGPVVVYIEGVAGQRVRVYVGGGDDMMFVHLQHDDRCDVNAEKVSTAMGWFE